MDRSAIKELVTKKQAQQDSVMQSIATLRSKISELTAALGAATELKSRLDIELQSLAEDVRILSYAIGLDEDRSASSMINEGPAIPGLEVKSPGIEQAPIALDLDTADMSNGERRVQQHTLDVRRNVAKFLKNRGASATIEIVEHLDEIGQPISEENKVANLSAILSRTKFFESKNRRWTLDMSALQEQQKDGDLNAFG